MQDRRWCSREIWALRSVTTFEAIEQLETTCSGLELAQLADLAHDVMEEGKRVAVLLADLRARQEEESHAGVLAAQRRAILRVCSVS